MKLADIQRKHWNNRASDYEAFYGLQSRIAWQKIARKAKMIAEFTGMRKGCRVLEIGCGTGLFTWHYAIKYGTSVEATDISGKMISGKILNNVRFSVADAHTLPFNDNSFDIVVGSYVLQYVNLDIVLEEIRRVLVAGGRLGFVELNKLNPICYAMTNIGFIRRLKGEPEFAQSFTASGIKNSLFAYGFVQVRTSVIEFVGNRRANRFIESIPLLDKFGGSLVFSAVKEIR